jgi:aminopeptidase N
VNTPETRQLCLAHFNAADNMTNSIAALGALSHMPSAERDQALQVFEARWTNDSLVMDKWFSVQAISQADDTLTRVRALMDHPLFDLKKPNKVRALIGAFAHGNPPQFHQATGNGYRFLSDRVIALDALNPQIAARLVGAFARWKRLTPALSDKMQAALKTIADTPQLSRDCQEIVSKTLAA